jgi:multidrug efflux system membrane fusion protein
MRAKRWVGGVVAVLGLVALLWLLRTHADTQRQAASSAAESLAARPVPVLAATAVRQDVPIYLEGLGTVVANRTVTVKPLVDGRLDQVLFQEGQLVHKGQALAQIDPRPFLVQLHQAEGALARDKAQLENGRLNVRRDQDLVNQKLIAQQQLDTDAATVGQLEGTVQIDQATIESARLNLDYARITSPVEGVTGVRIVDPGNVVHASDPNGIVVVTQLDPVAVVFTLPQDELPRLAEQMAKGRLPVEAFSRDGATRLGAGQLELIDNQINQTTATLRLKATFPNPKHLLWPNQFVKARLLLSTHRNALVVPATALQRGPAGIFVYVIGKDQTVAMKPVQAAPPQNDLAIVDKGLAEGEQVVADGQGQLRPGSRVAPREQGRTSQEASLGSGRTAP